MITPERQDPVVGPVIQPNSARSFHYSSKSDPDVKFDKSVKKKEEKKGKNKKKKEPLKHVPTFLFDPASFPQLSALSRPIESPDIKIMQSNMLRTSKASPCDELLDAESTVGKREMGTPPGSVNSKFNSPLRTSPDYLRHTPFLIQSGDSLPKWSSLLADRSLIFQRIHTQQFIVEI